MDAIDIKLQAFRCRLAGMLVQEKFEAFMRAFERCYASNQPRDDRGRWTDGGGGTSDDGEGGGTRDDRFTEEPAGTDTGTGDPEARIHPVAYEPDKYRVDLREEEARGGHPISAHVGKTDEFLKERVRIEADKTIERGHMFEGLSVGSFTSVEAANKLVSSTLAQNREVVDQVARGEIPSAFLSARFGSLTGYEAYLQTYHSEPYIRETYGVGAFILRDRQAPFGYRVQSAYPLR